MLSYHSKVILGVIPQWSNFPHSCQTRCTRSVILQSMDACYRPRLSNVGGDVCITGDTPGESLRVW